MPPRSVVGRWLLATALHEPAEVRDSWGRRLNGGQPGFNADEPMVVLAVCGIAVRRYFERTERAYATPDEFAAAMADASPSLNVPVDKLARLARAARDGSRRPDDLTPGELFRAAALLFVFASQKLGWERPAIERLVSEAEQRVAELGYAPTPADPQT